jgi:hypothetical protein
MVIPSDDGILVAYSTGSKVKSAKIEPLEAAEALLLLGKTPPEEISKLFDAMFAEYSAYLESAYANVSRGFLDSFDAEEVERVGGKWKFLESLLNIRFEIEQSSASVRLWQVRNMPLPYQIGWAKCRYIEFMLRITECIANKTAGWWDAKGPEGQLLPVPYEDGYGMWPEDWERLFLHYSIVRHPFLTEEVKKRAKDNSMVSTVLVDEQAPSDYKSWF